MHCTSLIGLALVVIGLSSPQVIITTFGSQLLSLSASQLESVERRSAASPEIAEHGEGNGSDQYSLRLGTGNEDTFPLRLCVSHSLQLAVSSQRHALRRNHRPALRQLFGTRWCLGWGQHVFQTNITVFTNGSGDTTYDYVQAFCFLTMALAATAIWTCFDRQRSYARLYDWLRVYVRFSLALALISYGAAKVNKSQFPNPDARPPRAALWRRFADGAAVDFHGSLCQLQCLYRRR